MVDNNGGCVGDSGTHSDVVGGTLWTNSHTIVVGSHTIQSRPRSDRSSL